MIVDYYVTEFFWFISMLKQFFLRASDSGLLWVGQPTDMHRQLLSNIQIRLTTMPSSFETLCALEQLRLAGEVLPVILVEAGVAQRDRDCLAKTIRQVDEFKELIVVLFGSSDRQVTNDLYQHVIVSNSDLVAGNNVLLQDKTVPHVKPIPDGLGKAGRVLLLENNSTRRLIAQGLLRSLNIDHVIMDDIPGSLDSSSYDMVFISHEMLDLPNARRILEPFARKVLMGGAPLEAFESISIPMREKDLVTLFQGKSQVKKEKRVEVPDTLPTEVQPFVVNTDEVRARLGVSVDILKLVLTTYRADLDKQLQQIRDAIASRHPAHLKSAAHLIKGAASTVGAHELSQFASLLEQKAMDELPEASVSDGTLALSEKLYHALEAIKRDLNMTSEEAEHGQ